MPDDRFFHKRAGHSVKVNRLSDFEELIWRYYVLSSDDFGVMRFDHRQIQNDHERAGNRKPAIVMRALEIIRDVGLVHLFDHQGRPYCYSRNWQHYQKIAYPRETLNPCPPADEIAVCEIETAKLFYLHPGGKEGREKKLLLRDAVFGERVPTDSVNARRIDPDSVGIHSSLTRAGALAEAKAKASGNGSEGGVGETGADVGELTAIEARAGRFVERYGELFQQFRHGARYVSKPALDYQEALRLVEAWDDARLERLVEAFLTTDDAFCRGGSASLAHFRSRASWCDSKLRESGL